MAPPPKKRRLESNGIRNNGDAANSASTLSNLALAPITAQERRQWQGFCELESEPAFFNVMLKDFGVKGVKVQEVFGLDDELLAMLPQPVYGLIFLFRYKSVDAHKQEASCPDNVWFANQTHDFACATVSLLNIVNNIPDVDIGEHLRSFKNFTKDFTPAMRGDQIGSFEFVKQIHNSFARKMDMLNIDLSMDNAFSDRKKKKPTTKQKKGSKITDDDFIDDDAAFHFIAFVPVDGEVWGLDGLNRQPEQLGGYASDIDWLSVVTPVLQARIAEYAEDQIEFNLLSLVRDPLLDHRVNLTAYTRGLEAIDARLKILNPEWRIFADDKLDSVAKYPNGMLVTPAHLDELSPGDIPESVIEKLKSPCPAQLMTSRRELVASISNLSRMMREEEETTKDDERRARERRHDYGPVIHTWLRMLAEQDGVVKELVESSR